MYIEWDIDHFAGLKIEVNTELYEFVESIKTGDYKFEDYPPEKLNIYAKLIYELRKDNTNNPTGQIV